MTREMGIGSMARNLAQSELAYLPCPLYGLRYSFERLCVPVLVLACTPGRETLRSMRTGCACCLGFAIGFENLGEWV